MMVEALIYMVVGVSTAKKPALGAATYGAGMAGWLGSSGGAASEGNTVHGSMGPVVRSGDRPRATRGPSGVGGGASGGGRGGVGRWVEFQLE